MSVSLTVSDQLSATLEELKNPSSPVQLVKIQIIGEILNQITVQNGPPTKDFKVLAQHASSDSAAYFLLRIAPTKWASINYVPENVSKVKERMMYASSYGSFKTSFGLEYIAEDHHLASFEEISGKTFEKTPSREELLSNSEKTIKEAIRQENIARKEQENGMRQGEIGGYHAVSLSFSDDCEEAFASFKNGEINWIELAVSADQKSIEKKNSKSVAAGELPSLVCKTEPRFYFYKVGVRSVFIYCCPSKSQTKFRMIYSTCKPSVLDGAAKAGLVADKKLEFSESDEVNHGNIQDEINAPTRSYGGSPQSTSKPPSPNVVSSSHPVYGLMKEGGSPKLPGVGGRSEFEAGVISVGKKKIVLPPSVAYQ